MTMRSGHTLPWLYTTFKAQMFQIGKHDFITIYDADELWPAKMHVSFDAEFKTKKELEEFLEKIKEVAVQNTINAIRNL